MTFPTVVLVGRINVGKSSVFNRLTESTKAIVSSVPGTTRDRNFSDVEWNRKRFTLIDSGGVDVDLITHSIDALVVGKKKLKKILGDESIDANIVRQTRHGLEQADLVVMVVDGQTGILPQDKTLALALKKSGKPILLAVNKIDSPRHSRTLADFYRLGLGEPQPLSAANGSGSGDLLDAITKRIKGSRGRQSTKKVEAINIALIGKPNVGKSSIVNRLVGEERVIVSPVAQTTREPQDTELMFDGKKIVLIDTAGLRKKSNTDSGIERQANTKTLATIKRADVVLFVTESDKELTAQDRHLAGLLNTSRAGIVVIANKWDNVKEKSAASAGKLLKTYQAYFPYLRWTPILATAALTGQGIDKVLPTAIAVAARRGQTLPQDRLNEILRQATRRHFPAQAKGAARPKIYGITQVSTNPPEFELAIGKRQSVHFSYLRYIENQIRQEFDFVGVPLNIHTVSKRH